jgi:superfamily II DNA or RNA helicase
MYHLGGLEPFYVDLSREQPMTWMFRQMRQAVSEQDEARCYRRRPGSGKPKRVRGRVVTEYQLDFMRPKFETFACDLTKPHALAWADLILHDLQQAAESGRSAILLGTRVEWMEQMCAELIERGVNAGLAVGHTKQKERRRVFRECQVIFVTDKMAYKALDIPRIDTLFLPFPSKNPNFLRQASGRLDRRMEGKQPPLVVTYSHRWVESMQRAESDMNSIIREIDPEGTIRNLGRAA